LHLPNAFFGVGWPAAVQVVLAFMMGSGLYSLRRLTGTLVVPMIVHAVWDYLTFTLSVSQHTPDAAQMGAMLVTYLLSLSIGWKLSGVRA
jgi:membrane protease YdiL (CAAX protease family)